MRSVERGYTLIELMIGMLVGLIVLSGVIYALLISLSSSRNVLNSARLNQEISTINDLIVGEVKRAGYWPASTASAAAPSPYQSGTETALSVVGTDCVLYSYDLDGDQLIEDSERQGFKLATTAGVGVIQVRLTGTAMNDCSNGTWQGITDERFMDVTSFSVTENAACLSSTTGVSVACGAVSAAYVSVRELSISMEAEVLSDRDWKGRFEDVVKVRNNEVID
jgi:prepilin-type N-terminal cleavage/methylation domain-containing protein